MVRKILAAVGMEGVVETTAVAEGEEVVKVGAAAVTETDRDSSITNWVASARKKLTREQAIFLSEGILTVLSLKVLGPQ
jgi:hypothetical protein